MGLLDGSQAMCADANLSNAMQCIYICMPTSKGMLWEKNGHLGLLKTKGNIAFKPL
jgi:hypothetical protein